MAGQLASSACADTHMCMLRSSATCLHTRQSLSHGMAARNCIATDVMYGVVDAGVECKACSDKGDLVAKVRESIHLPAKAKDEPKGGPGGKDADLQDILSRLKGMPGMENMNVRNSLTCAWLICNSQSRAAACSEKDKHRRQSAP